MKLLPFKILRLVDDLTLKLVDESSTPSCVLDLETLKQARAISDLYEKTNGVRPSKEEVLDYAVSLQVFHQETNRGTQDL